MLQAGSARTAAVSAEWITGGMNPGTERYGAASPHSTADVGQLTDETVNVLSAPCHFLLFII